MECAPEKLLYAAKNSQPASDDPSLSLGIIKEHSRSAQPWSLHEKASGHHHMLAAVDLRHGPYWQLVRPFQTFSGPWSLIQMTSPPKVHKDERVCSLFAKNDMLQCTHTLASQAHLCAERSTMGSPLARS